MYNRLIIGTGTRCRLYRDKMLIKLEQEAGNTGHETLVIKG